MEINISGDTEDLISRQIASGTFDSPEEAVDAMARFWTGMKCQIAVLPDDVDIDEIAARQGVVPLAQPAEQLRGNFWPENESMDEFLEQLRENWQQGTPR